VPTERVSRLKIKLLEADEPQYVVAAVCRMHPSQLSEYALGQRPMSIKHLRALAKYFGCRQQDLQGWLEVEYETD
jgi:transcriptional regulator with XRE-family HTH domain